MVKLIGKIEICSIYANFCKLAPGSSRKMSKKCLFWRYFALYLQNKYSGPLYFFFAYLIDKFDDLKYFKNLKKKSIERNLKYNWKCF